MEVVAIALRAVVVVAVAVARIVAAADVAGCGDSHQSQQNDKLKHSTEPEPDIVNDRWCSGVYTGKHCLKKEQK